MTGQKHTDLYAELSFEEALAKLKEIVNSLENSNLKLEDAISAYEKGARLKQQCEKKLQDAELKVQAIKQNSDQTLELTNME